MNSISLRPQRPLALKSGHVAGWAAATVVATCSATSAMAVTRVTFDSNSEQLISLAGSTSPLYGIKQSQETQRSNQTIQKCNSPGKFGGCDGGYSTIIRTTTTQLDTTDFISASPDALIGISTYDSAMPTANELFTTNSANITARSQIRSISDQGYSAVPFVPQPQISYPLASAFLHLKFVVDGNTYLGLAKFDDSSDPRLSYIDYEALSSAPTAVPEPESWAMLIAGFGLTGAALRRSRRQGQRVQAAL